MPIPQTHDWSSRTAFFAGMSAMLRSVFSLVMFGNFVGIGALAHDFGFSLVWVCLTTLLIWAGPAQVILITALGGGAPLVEVALAVGLSGVRLLPMVVSLVPMIKNPGDTPVKFLLPAHLTAVTMWVESFRLLPPVPRAHRVAYCNGIGLGLMAAAMAATIVGFYLAGGLPKILAGALLFLTPMAFLVSVARNARLAVDWVALGAGLIIGPILAMSGVGLDLLWTGLAGGIIAYGVHRLRRRKA